MFYLVIVLFVLFIFFMLSNLLELKHSLKGSDPFECGFSPKGTAHAPFSFHFFLLGVIFIVFDVEIILLFPVVMNFTELGIVFCLVVILGLFYEIYAGTLCWL
uniref:NADH-ubiquinone oxidoreductase chain 3 n=1 Tax=Bryozoa sp. TaxID=2813608 RepID=A0AAU8L1B8_9BILA